MIGECWLYSYSYVVIIMQHADNVTRQIQYYTVSIERFLYLLSRLHSGTFSLQKRLGPMEVEHS